MRAVFSCAYVLVLVRVYVRGIRYGVGLWGVCFTYGTWFGVEGLLDAGVEPTYVHLHTHALIRVCHVWCVQRIALGAMPNSVCVV